MSIGQSGIYLPYCVLKKDWRSVLPQEMAWCGPRPQALPHGPGHGQLSRVRTWVLTNIREQTTDLPSFLPSTMLAHMWLPMFIWFQLIVGRLFLEKCSYIHYGFRVSPKNEFSCAHERLVWVEGSPWLITSIKFLPLYTNSLMCIEISCVADFLPTFIGFLPSMNWFTLMKGSMRTRSHVYIQMSSRVVQEITVDSPKLNNVIGFLSCMKSSVCQTLAEFLFTFFVL